MASTEVSGIVVASEGRSGGVAPAGRMSAMAAANSCGRRIGALSENGKISPVAEDAASLSACDLFQNPEAFQVDPPATWCWYTLHEERRRDHGHRPLRGDDREDGGLGTLCVPCLYSISGQMRRRRCRRYGSGCILRTRDLIFTSVPCGGSLPDIIRRGSCLLFRRLSRTSTSISTIEPPKSWIGATKTLGKSRNRLIRRVPHEWLGMKTLGGYVWSLPVPEGQGIVNTHPPERCRGEVPSPPDEAGWQALAKSV